MRTYKTLMKPAVVRVNMVAASYALLLAAAGSSGAPTLASSTGKVNLTLTSNYMSTTWNQLGKTLRRENTQAISLDYGPDGFPVFAYGWDDPGMSNELGFL